MVTPDYYKKFKCPGGECKHNCCRGGWEIEIDDDALERFGRLGGEFGERVRAAISEENTFRHTDGHCPLLNGDGWCEMALRGEELCVVCDEYPRFTEYFGEYAERGISLSCEAAAEIILNSEFALDGISAACGDEMFILLYKARETIFGILQNRENDIYTRIRLVLDYSKHLQEHINENCSGEFAYIPSDDMPICDTESNSLTEYFDFMGGLEILNEDWRQILTSERKCGNAPTEEQTERLAIYFVYRYFLKAVFDCDALSKIKFMAVSVAAIARLAERTGDTATAARLYSVEIEHNEENLEEVYDAFLFDEFLSYESILQMLR